MQAEHLCSSPCVRTPAELDRSHWRDVDERFTLGGWASMKIGPLVGSEGSARRAWIVGHCGYYYPSTSNAHSNTTLRMQSVARLYLPFPMVEIECR